VILRSRVRASLTPQYFFKKFSNKLKNAGKDNTEKYKKWIMGVRGGAPTKIQSQWLGISKKKELELL
jgi:hypothetical protein